MRVSDPIKVDARHLWEGLQKGARRLAEAARDETVRASKMGNLRLEVVRLSRLRRERCRQLGEKLYDLLVKGEAFSAELFEPDRSLIAQIDEQIAQKKTQIEGLRVSRASSSASP